MVTGKQIATQLFLAVFVTTWIPSGALAYYKENLVEAVAGGSLTVTPLHPDPGTSSPMPGETGLRHIGSGKGEPLSSSGRAVPFGIAVHLIMPSGWNAEVPQDIAGKEVSWDSRGRDWTDVLGEVALYARVLATLDWNARKVTLSGSPAKEAPREEVAEPAIPPSPAPDPPVAGESAPQKADSLALPILQKMEQPAFSAPYAVPSPDVSRPISPGPLSAQLAKWCADSGYQLVWKVGHDLNMTSHAVFRGTLSQALADVFTGLAGAGHPLRVTIHEGNRVVEVVEE